MWGRYVDAIGLKPSRNLQKKTFIRDQNLELTIHALPWWYHSPARGWRPLWIFLRWGGNSSLSWWFVYNLATYMIQAEIGGHSHIPLAQNMGF
jgi:hypothetical protein